MGKPNYVTGLRERLYAQTRTIQWLIDDFYVEWERNHDRECAACEDDASKGRIENGCAYPLPSGFIAIKEEMDNRRDKERVNL